MVDFSIEKIQIDDFEVVKQDHKPTPLQISVQTAGMRSELLEDDEDSMPKLNLKYQRLPIRTIYEEISILDWIDDNEKKDLPKIFKVANKIKKLRIPIKPSVLCLKNKLDIYSNRNLDKNNSSNKKKNQEPNIGKHRSLKSNKVNNKKPFNFVNLKKLQECLNYKGNHKKLFQAESAINSNKKPTSAKKSIKPDFFWTFKKNQWEDTKNLGSKETVTKSIRKNFLYDLKAKLNGIKALSKRKNSKKHRKSNSKDDLMLIMRNTKLC